MNMKEFFSALAIIAALLASGAGLKKFHDIVQRAALEKAALGLPSLQMMTKTLRGQSSKKPKSP